jgi:hypothetical protein
MPRTITARKTLEDVIASARTLIHEQERALAELEKNAQGALARGTRELAPIAATNGASSLQEQVVALLTAEALDAATVARRLGVPVGRVQPVMKVLRDGLKIHNIGSEVEPRWQHVIGDDATTAELRALILRLISERPFTHRELVTVTGVTGDRGGNRVSGVLAKLREEFGERLWNFGDGSVGNWCIKPAGAQPAPLRKSR